MRGRPLGVLLGILSSLAMVTPVAAQGSHEHQHGDTLAASEPARPADRATADADHTMSGVLDMSAHMRMTERRPATAADSARAAAIADTLRRAIAKYRDVALARADGFRQFARGLRKQRVYHFTSSRQAFREHFRFDPAQPTSLLYRKDAEGRFVLVGAMYVAPKDATPEELDRRVPLGIARWHAHTNICVPPLRQRARWLERRNGQMVFGPAGAVSTKADCAAVGGRFHPQLFGWMVHANVFAGDDPAVIWGDGHAAR